MSRNELILSHEVDDLNQRVANQNSELEGIRAEGLKYNEANQKLEKQVKGLKGKARRDNIAGVAGVATGAGAVGYFLGDVSREVGEGIGEVYHGMKVVSNLGKFGSNVEEGIMTEYVEMLPEGVSGVYLDNLDNESLIVDGSREALDALQRGAMHFPGQEVEPVRNIRGLKGSIIQKTKGWITGDKEEAEIQNTEQYAENYDDLARLRTSALLKREGLKDEIGDYCGKLYLNEQNTGNVGEGGLEVLENLVVQHNNLSGLLSNIGELDIRDINEGELNEGYQGAVQDAKDFGVKGYSVDNWGDAGFLASLVVGAYLGNKFAKPVFKAGNLAYSLGSGAVKRTAKGVGALARGIKSITGGKA